MEKLKEYVVYYEIEMRVFVEAADEDEAVEKAKLIPPEKWEKFEGEMFEVCETYKGE